MNCSFIRTNLTDARPLALFRVWFGLALVSAMGHSLLTGKVRTNYIEAQFHQRYEWFAWLPELPEPWIYLPFILVLGTAGLLALGGFVKVSAFTIFLCYGYIFLLDALLFNNHYYLIVLSSLLLVFIDSDRAWCLRPKQKAGGAVVPMWQWDLVRFQVAIPYILGGIQKIHEDWLFRAEPLAWHLERTSEFPLIGHWLITDAAALIISWGGLLFDLLIVPALLWRRTRWFAIGAALLFHAFNSQLFNLGIFPFLMFGLTLVFIPWRSEQRGRSKRVSKNLACLLYVYVIIQLVVPLRHFLYKGNVLWNDRGILFAWHLKPKRQTTGKQFYEVDRRDGSSKPIDVDGYLAPWQRSRLCTPKAYRQFARWYWVHHVESEHQGWTAIHIDAFRGVNGREPQRLIELNADLTQLDKYPASHDWICEE